MTVVQTGDFIIHITRSDTIEKVVLPIDEVIEQIHKYAKYPVGWEFGEGEAFSYKNTKNYIYTYRVFKILGFEGEAHPNTEGTIHLTAFKDKFAYEIDVDESAVVTIRVSVGIGDNYTILRNNDKVKVHDLVSYIINVSHNPTVEWNKITSFERFPSINTQHILRGSRTRRSSIHTKGAYLSSLIPVQETH